MDKIEEFKKSLIAKGMSESDADEVCKGFPFDKKDDKEPDGDKDDKGKTEKAVPDPEAIEKAVGKLRAVLDKPAGLSEDEVNDRINKAVAAVKDPLQQHAVAISEVVDNLLKAQEAEGEQLRKGISGLIDAVQGLAAGHVGLQKALDEKGEALAKAVTALETVTAASSAQFEEVKKAIATPAAAATIEAPRSVQFAAEVIDHPANVKDAAVADWSKAEVLKKAVEIGKMDPDRANKIREDLLIGKRTPDRVAKEFGLEK